jgi:argininosuccinate lyase
MLEAATEGHTTATAVADALVRRGVPFRAAHHIVGSLVAQADEAGVRLDAVPDSMIGLALGASGDPTAGTLAAETGIGDELRTAASIEGALASCDVIGGTAPRRVQAALEAARARLDGEGAG